MASENGYHETVQLLLKKGADPNSLDKVRLCVLIMCGVAVLCIYMYMHSWFYIYT